VPVKEINVARSKQSHRADKEKTKASTRIEHPFVVYSSYNPGERMETMRWLVDKFMSAEAARGHINALIGQDSWEYDGITVLKYPGIRTSTGITITLRSQDMLDQVMSLDYEEERMTDDVRYFKFRRVADRKAPEDRPEYPEHQSKNRRSKADKKSVPRSVPRDRSGMVSANQIAEELGCQGSAVRSVLRAMKLEKPQGGWYFDKEVAEEIKAKVRKKLK